ncbi:MAG: hypothetical protein LBI02_03670 [Opitutaceae bacterium]|nr:hypothetical protein [Opitutaceae bacterium]
MRVCFPVPAKPSSPVRRRRARASVSRPALAFRHLTPLPLACALLLLFALTQLAAGSATLDAAGDITLTTLAFLRGLFKRRVKNDPLKNKKSTIIPLAPLIDRHSQ